MLQSYKAYFNQLVQHFFKFIFTDKIVNNSFLKTENTSIKRTLAPRVSSSVFTNQQLSNILVNYLTTQHTTHNQLTKQLSLNLFQSLSSTPNLTSTLSCFKKLFMVVDALCKPNTNTLQLDALRSDIQKTRLLQLLTHSSFQNYTPLVLDFYLRVKNQKHITPLKPFAQFT